MDDDRLKRIEQNGEWMRERLHSIDKTLIIQGANLKEHMRRTRLNEKALTLYQKDIANEIRPVKRHVEGMNYMLKAVGVLALCLTVAFTAMKSYEWLTDKPARKESHEKVPYLRPLPAKKAGA